MLHTSSKYGTILILFRISIGEEKERGAGGKKIINPFFLYIGIGTYRPTARRKTPFLSQGGREDKFRPKQKNPHTNQ